MPGQPIFERSVALPLNILKVSTRLLLKKYLYQSGWLMSNSVAKLGGVAAKLLGAVTGIAQQERFLRSTRSTGGRIKLNPPHTLSQSAEGRKS